MIILKIKKIELLSYGKIKNLELILDPGLNIIFGENESGKSTIRSFIFNMLYGGTTPGSNRANYTKDYERHIPWDTPRFEGSLLIEDDGNDYLFHRNFQKRNEYFSARNLLDGSNARDKFYIDQSRRVQVIGDEYFGITESTLRDLFLISEEVEMEENLSKDLKDRIINQMSTKSEKVSIGNVISRIENNTDTRDIRREMRNLDSEIKNIDKKISENYSFNENKDFNDISKIDEDLYKLNQAEMNQKNIIEALLDEKNNYENELEQNDISYEEEYLIEEIEKVNKFNIFTNYLLPILTFIIGIIIYLMTDTLPLALIIILFSVILFFIVFNKKSLRDEKIQRLYNKLDIIKNKESAVINTNINKLKSEIELLENIRTKKTNLTIHRESVLNDIERKQSKTRELENLRVERKKLVSKLDELSFKQKMGREAIKIINDLTKKSFRNISSTLIEDASYFLSYITNGKYEKLYITEKGDISVYDTEIRRIVDVEELSKGTISQIYLSYRLALIENSGVEFPIIIDEGLSFYDQRRQDSTMKLLEQISEKHQIIFFTNNYRDYSKYKNELIGNFIEL